MHKASWTYGIILDDAIVEAVSQSDFFDLLVDTSGQQQQQHQSGVHQPAVADSNAFKDSSDMDTINGDTVPGHLADYFLDPHWDLTHENTSSDISLDLFEMPAAPKVITPVFPQNALSLPSEECVAVQYNSPVKFTIEPLVQPSEIDGPQELSIHKSQPSIKSAKKSAKNSGSKSSLTSSAEKTRHANNEACARYRARRAAGWQSLEAERDVLLARNAQLRTRLEEKRRALTLLQDSLIKAYIKWFKCTVYTPAYMKQLSIYDQTKQDLNK